MDALLILAGLLLILAGLFWLIGKAFETSLFWGFGTLLPPGGVLYAIRFWSRARPCLQLMGVGLMIFVVGMSMLAQRAPDRLERILSFDWAAEQASPAALQLDLQGEFNGVPFQPVMAELIDGVLSFSEGDDLSRREVRVHLKQQPSGPLQLDLLPQDEGQLPLIELVWVSPDSTLPEARRITHGYTLHLDLQPGRPNRMQGSFHLQIPGDEGASLSGSLEVYTSRLRYLDEDNIDPRFNSRETVEWLISRHLQAVARTHDLEFVRLPPLDTSLSRLDLSIDVRVAGELQTTRLILQHDDAAGWRIASDPQPLTPVVHLVKPDLEAMRQPESAKPPVVRPEPEVVQPVDRRDNFNLQRLQLNPQVYQGLRVRVRTERGGIAEGQFIGLSRDGRLQVRYAIGGGEATFILRPSEVTRIELLEP